MEKKQEETVHTKTQQEENARAEIVETETVQTEAEEKESEESQDREPQDGEEQPAPDQLLTPGMRLSYTVRVLGGLYLLYVEYGMFKTMGEVAGGHRLISYAFMLLFAAAAFLFLYSGLRGLKRYYDEEKNGDCNRLRSAKTICLRMLTFL